MESWITTLTHSIIDLLIAILTALELAYGVFRREWNFSLFKEDWLLWLLHEFCLELNQLFFESSVLAEDPESTIGNEDDETEGEVSNGDDVKCFSLAYILVEIWTKEWRDEIRKCIHEPVSIIDFIIQHVVYFKVFALRYPKSDLESLKHLRDNRNEHENLEDAKNGETSNNDPLVIWQIE